MPDNKTAEEIARKIIDNLKDRKGFFWNELDEDIQQEILSEITETIDHQNKQLAEENVRLKGQLHEFVKSVQEKQNDQT